MNQIPWENIQNKLRNPKGPVDEIFSNWLNENEDHRLLWKELQVIYSITGDIPQSFEPQKDLAWEQVAKRISVKKKKYSISQFMVRVAASILLIGMGIGGGLMIQKYQENNSFTEVYSPYGHKTMVVLPDSSKVWLNGNTRIKYHANFSRSRDVELTGEALFKIQKDSRNLFTISSGDIHLEVYGTTFNFKSYPEDGESEVALVEGSLGVFHNGNFLKKLVPGEIVTYNENLNKLNNIQGNIKYITSWQSDELVLENESFENIAKYLERWYGVEITLDESLKQDTRLSFKVKTESLSDLLSIIDYLIPVSYEINGKQVTIKMKTKS